MIAAPYDIFRKDLLGTPVWMEAVQDLETAPENQGNCKQYGSTLV